MRAGIVLTLDRDAGALQALNERSLLRPAVRFTHRRSPTADGPRARWQLLRPLPIRPRVKRLTEPRAGACYRSYRSGHARSTLRRISWFEPSHCWPPRRLAHWSHPARRPTPPNVCARDAPGRWSWARARRSLGESLVQSGRRCAPASVIAPPDRPAWRSPVFAAWLAILSRGPGAGIEGGISGQPDAALPHWSGTRSKWSERSLRQCC